LRFCFVFENFTSASIEKVKYLCRDLQELLYSRFVSCAFLAFCANFLLKGAICLNQEKIGRFIAQARKKKAYTQEQLAEKLGVSNRTVSRWENGSAMRVSPCGFFANSLEEAQALAKASAEVTHNHPEGIKGAVATASSIFLARQGKTKEEIKTYIQENYYPMDFTLAEIRPTYEFDVSCQGSVPQALECFFESADFEDAIRNCISIGGDSDTIAAICGGVAEAYYGIPEDIQNTALSYLDDNLLDIVTAFEQAVSEQGKN
jgi:ADP-ribosylglycohydrolase